jgi:hypothetical protein
MGEFLIEIKARYLASVGSIEPPSLLDICAEFDLIEQNTKKIVALCEAESWETIRLTNYQATQKALMYQSESVIGELTLNFHKAMKSVLAERLMKFTKFNNLIDAQLLARLESDGGEDSPTPLSAAQLIRMKELMLKEASDIVRVAYDIAKELSGDAGAGGEDAQGTEGAMTAINKWKAGAIAVEATGTTHTPDEAKGQTTESERASLFNRLDKNG